MNIKPERSGGPKMLLTKPANRFKNLDPPLFQPKPDDAHKYVYTCQYCSLKFTHNSQFFRHTISNHEFQQSQAKFECNECQVVFNKKNYLDIHFQTSHRGKSKSKCQSCSITFKSRYCLRRHLKLKQVMSENSCFKCQKKCMSKENLLKHINNKHTFKNTTFQCDMCLLKFRVKESLESHLKRIHKKL